MAVLSAALVGCARSTIAVIAPGATSPRGSPTAGSAPPSTLDAPSPRRPLAPSTPDAAVPTATAALTPTPGPRPISYEVIAPLDASQRRQPLPVVVALHGQGGNGRDYSRSLGEIARREGWVLVAPTVPYRDWRDVDQVRRDGAEVIPWLRGLIDRLGDETGLRLAPRAVLYGFSRGCQTAHRFALFYPERAQAVVCLSAGTYTLPQNAGPIEPVPSPLIYPFGVADIERYTGRPFQPDRLREVSFFVGVGENDNRVEELPRIWDHLGRTRVDRAQTFVQALRHLGTSVRHVVFPRTGHEETVEMRAQAVAFVRGIVQ
ncbi:MAG: hypothetical protein HYY04_03495 [Chloroflexi bacterium]|nr:hypothetical protein [Chloroflexota bacterium]